MNKVCCIFNYAPQYRSAIFQLMDKELQCDFYFGDSIFIELEKMDYQKIKGFKGELKTYKYKSWKWHFPISRFFFKKYDTYIITGDSSFLSNWLLVLICRIKNKQIYMWTHGLKTYPRRKVGNPSILFYKLATGGILLYSAYSKDILLNLGFSSSKLFVIYNSLDYQYQLAIRKQLKISNLYTDHFNNDFPVLIFIGRIQKAKKLDLLIEALRLLKVEGSNYNLVIIGKEVEPTGIKELVKTYKLSDNVWFFGPSYDEACIGQMIFNANACISPGNVGLTALHSLVYGTPVITHNDFRQQGPEFESIDNGYNGLFFEENSIEDLKEKIELMVGITLIDRELVRERCFGVVQERYNPRFQIDLLKSIIK